MMRPEMLREVLIGVPVWLVLACGASPRSVTPTPDLPAGPAAAGPATSAAMEEQSKTGCPGGDADTRVFAQKTDRGGALVFTTPDDVVDLRRRVRALDVPAEELGDPRPDKIRRGIRLVFGTEDPSKAAAVHQALERYAEGIADRCGLSLAPPKPEPERAAAKPKVLPPPVTAPVPLKAAPTNPFNPVKLAPGPAPTMKLTPPKPQSEAAKPVPPPARPPKSTTPGKAPPKLPALPGPPRQPIKGR